MSYDIERNPITGAARLVHPPSPSRGGSTFKQSYQDFFYYFVLLLFFCWGVHLPIESFEHYKPTQGSVHKNWQTHIRRWPCFCESNANNFYAVSSSYKISIRHPRVMSADSNVIHPCKIFIHIFSCIRDVFLSLCTSKFDCTNNWGISCVQLNEQVCISLNNCNSCRIKFMESMAINHIWYINTYGTYITYMVHENMVQLMDDQAT